MLLQHQQRQLQPTATECQVQSESQRKTLTDEEVLVWCYTNANSQFMSANNALEIIVNLCSCSAKDIDLAKVIRSQIQFVSDQLSNKSYQTVIHCSNDTNSSSCCSSPKEAEQCQRIGQSLDNEIDNLRNTQNLLRKKYRLLSLLRTELTNSGCECVDTNSPLNGNILSHLRANEFNCKMWFRQIKVIETKLQCLRQSLPFDVFKVVSQLLDSNQLNINSIPIAFDFNNNNNNTESNGLINSCNNEMKSEKSYSENDCSVNELVGDESGYGGVGNGFNGLIASEYSTNVNENSFTDSHKNMQILRYDSLLSVNEANSLALEPINSNDMTTNGCGVGLGVGFGVSVNASAADTDMTDAGVDSDVSDTNGPTFQELHPISSNVGLNYSVHEIPHLIRSSAAINQVFDYRTNNCNTNANNHFNDDILPQITAIEIDQILNT